MTYIEPDADPHPEVTRIDQELRGHQTCSYGLREAIRYGELAAMHLRDEVKPTGELHRRCDEFLRDLRLALGDSYAAEHTATAAVQAAWSQYLAEGVVQR